MKNIQPGGHYAIVRPDCIRVRIAGELAYNFKRKLIEITLELKTCDILDGLSLKLGPEASPNIEEDLVVAGMYQFTSSLITFHHKAFTLLVICIIKINSRVIFAVIIVIVVIAVIINFHCHHRRFCFFSSLSKSTPDVYYKQQHKEVTDFRLFIHLVIYLYIYLFIDLLFQMKLTTNSLT